MDFAGAARRGGSAIGAAPRGASAGAACLVARRGASGLGCCCGRSGWAQRPLLCPPGPAAAARSAAPRRPATPPSLPPGVLNALLARDPAARRRSIALRTYAVIPLADDCGILQWVDNLVAFKVGRRGAAAPATHACMGFVWARRWRVLVGLDQEAAPRPALQA
jgi:hypothetical protein